jgi:hypothetical protein
MKPRLLGAAILLCWISGSAWAADVHRCAIQASSRQESAEQAIKRLEIGWLAAEYRGDVDYLDCLLDPGYKVIAGQTGKVRLKADLLASVAKNKSKTTAIPQLSSIIIVNGRFATAFSSMKGQKANGESYEAHYVDSYVLRNGAWRAVGGVDL